MTLIRPGAKALGAAPFSAPPNSFLDTHEISFHLFRADYDRRQFDYTDMIIFAASPEVAISPAQFSRRRITTLPNAAVALSS